MASCFQQIALFGDLRITSTSTERQKRSQNLAPVLVIISGKSLVFSRKIITSTDFYRYCAPDASAPVVVINQSPGSAVRMPRRRLAKVKSSCVEGHAKIRQRIRELLRLPEAERSNGSESQRIAKGAGGKGPRQKTSKIVKKCQKVFRHFSTIFAQGKKRQKSPKSVKKFFDIFRQFSRGTFFPAPFAIR